MNEWVGCSPNWKLLTQISVGEWFWSTFWKSVDREWEEQEATEGKFLLSPYFKPYLKTNSSKCALKWKYSNFVHVWEKIKAVSSYLLLLSHFRHVTTPSNALFGTSRDLKGWIVLLVTNIAQHCHRERRFDQVTSLRITNQMHCNLQLKIGEHPWHHSFIPSIKFVFFLPWHMLVQGNDWKKDALYHLLQPFLKSCRKGDYFSKVCELQRHTESFKWQKFAFLYYLLNISNLQCCDLLEFC